MNKLFKGWKDVFTFTFQQAIKVKSFKTATILISVLLFLVAVLANVLPAAFSDSEEDNSSLIETVYVKNETDFAQFTFDGFAEFAGEEFQDTVFKTTTDSIENLKTTLEGEESCDIILSMTKGEEGYDFEVHIPTVSFLSTEDCNSFLNQSIAYFQNQMILYSGISQEALAFASLPINHTSFFDGEEDDTIGQVMLQIFAPMVFGLILYIMILLYGQSVAKSVISEKTSKLMETLLTTIKPYALITGKVLAMFAVAMMQFIIWVGIAVGGFFLGDFLAGKISPEHTNFLLDTLSFMNDNGIFAFTIPAIILSILTVVLAFLFYCSLAGAVSSTLTSAENLSQGMSLFQLPVIFGFLASYMLPLYGAEETLLTVLRFIPFTSAFMLPSDILLGNISIGLSCAMIAVLLIATIAMMLLTGKVYKDKVFYRGKNVLKSGFAKIGLFGRKF